ncbi:MAG: proteasome accessory factor PafA2 family protein, partial [Armatimonadetes bacterium]|nr:proteasome accessory factor PafA2 family protein [Armatimonadota bacterium]
ARFYNDHGHPEYATPECRSLRDLVAHDAAGERIVLASARALSQASGRKVTIYKNNTDFHGASYGTHESYLMQRSVPVQTLISAMLPFLATRQIYAGSGKVGSEIRERGGVGFQISQRADFLQVAASVDTLHNRPIFNTRDEPHASIAQYRRLHVICGDANMAQHSTALKVGATQLVVELLERGWSPKLELVDPVRAAHSVSRDLTLKETVECCDGSPRTAIEVQRIYLDAAQQLQLDDADAVWACAAWRDALDGLADEPEGMADRIDWVAKYRLLDTFREAEGLKWSDATMQSLDLAYHDLDPDVGLFHGLDAAGLMRNTVTPDQVEMAMRQAPADTRAAIRALFIRRFPGSVRSMGWGGILFNHGDQELALSLEPLVEANVAILNKELEAAGSVQEIIDALAKTA